MTGICIGIGDGWELAAHRTAKRMEAMTGVKCFVISEWDDRGAVSPAWMKCHIIADCRKLPPPYFLFDADILPMKPWDPRSLYRGRFAGTVEPQTDILRAECSLYNLNRLRYINGGLVMFDESHADIWAETWGKHPRYGSWLEQTALNKALVRHDIDLIPNTYNTLVRPNREDLSAKALLARPETNLHLCGLRGDMGTLLGVQESLGFA